MSNREIRKVPPNWEHPRVISGISGVPVFVPLFSGEYYQERLEEYNESLQRWNNGEYAEFITGASRFMTAEQYLGGPPKLNDHMPIWPPEEATHFMYYETCSEGTPISPAFATIEELAKWLEQHPKETDNDLSYDEWLNVCKYLTTP